MVRRSIIAQEPVFPGEERKHCDGKQRFANFNQAYRAVRNRRNKGHAYRCPECGGIHLAKQGKEDF